jgi:hypothetical protein
MSAELSPRQRAVRLVCLALLVGVQLTCIPEHEPWRNGSIEQFNGWLQERLLAIPLRSPGQVRRELEALMATCWSEHIHPQLNFQTTARVRRGLALRRLPQNFSAHQQPLPVAIGQVVFIRRVRPLRTHHRIERQVQTGQTLGAPLCGRHFVHAHHAGQDPSPTALAPSSRSSFRRQSQSVGTHLAVIGPPLLSALM